MATTPTAPPAEAPAIVAVGVSWWLTGGDVPEATGIVEAEDIDELVELEVKDVDVV